MDWKGRRRVTALALTNKLETYERLDLLARQRPEENAKRERLESGGGGRDLSRPPPFFQACGR